MFKDKNEELQRLEAELLLEAELEQAQALLDDPHDYGEETEQTYYNYSNRYGGCPAYNADTVDEDLEEYSDAVLREPDGDRRQVRRLLITALLLTTAIFAVLIWGVFRYLV